MIISKRRETSADTVCHLLSHVTSVSYAVSFMYHSTTSDTIRNIPTPHRRVFTLQHTLNREVKASEGQLLPKRFNLILGSQRFTNSKLKMAHRESVTFSKYPRPEDCIVSSVNG